MTHSGKMIYGGSKCSGRYPGGVLRGSHAPPSICAPWRTCTAAEDRAAVGRCLYELGVSMVCCRASAAAAVDAFACLNHGNEILRRCDLSAAATWVSVRRDPVVIVVTAAAAGRESSTGILDGVVVGTSTTTTAAADRSSARRPPPVLGAAIDQSGSPSTVYSTLLNRSSSPILVFYIYARARDGRMCVCVCVCACLCKRCVYARHKRAAICDGCVRTYEREYVRA